MKKIVLLASVLVLLPTAMIGRFIRPAEASETIYISSDYTFTSNIYEPIVVTADNIIIDGAGYTVQGIGNGTGIDLSSRKNVTLKNVEVTNFYIGIYLNDSSNNTIAGNNASNNEYGIGTNYSSNNVLSGNTASNNEYGISTNSSSNNVLTGNTASSNNGYGIVLGYSSNNVLSGNTASNNNWGIGVWYSSNNTLSGNTASSNNEYGIALGFSSNNAIAGNTASNNTNRGISLVYSSNNAIAGNTASNNNWGIYINYSSNNTLFHNNLINNTFQAGVTTGYVNTWDDGYPSGGNYWSDYTGVDLLDGGDGIGDSAHVIDADNQDNYPLMGPISFFEAGTWDEATYYVHNVSNSTVSDFYFNPDVEPVLYFNVTGSDGTTGFSRVAIPKELLWVENGWVVLVGGEPVVPTVTEDVDYTYLYFTYSHSTKTVEIQGTNVIPEFTTWASILLASIVLVAATSITRRRLLKTSIH